jgi:phosphoglycolate phosphatase-like HAD superfamily hydrolase
MIRAALFDLDGTLVKTEWLKMLSYVQAVQQLSPTPVTTEQVQRVFMQVVGRSREEVATTLLEHFNLADAARARLAEMSAQFPWQVLARLRMQVYDKIVADPKILRANQWEHNVALLRAAKQSGAAAPRWQREACRTANRSRAFWTRLDSPINSR